jgi:hypothetical protein
MCHPHSAWFDLAQRKIFGAVRGEIPQQKFAMIAFKN